MSSREQYKKYNTSLKKAVKNLEEKLSKEEAAVRSYKRTIHNLREALKATREMIILKNIRKGKLIWFLWGISTGMVIMFGILKLTGKL